MCKWFQTLSKRRELQRLKHGGHCETACNQALCAFYKTPRLRTISTVTGADRYYGIGECDSQSLLM